MRKPPPPAVPPLSDAALSRIERGVFAALDDREAAPAARRESGRRVIALALAGSVVAAAVFGIREWRQPDGGAARGAQITTGASGSHITLGGAALDIAPRSAVSFGGGKDGAVIVVLERGTVTCEVAPRSKRAPFIVQAGATRVTVIGTRFSVRRTGDHASVSVEHGLVEVADTNMTELVRAGELYQPGERVVRAPLASEDAQPAAPAAAPPASKPATPAPMPATPVELRAPPAGPRPHRRLVAREQSFGARPRVDEPAGSPASAAAPPATGQPAAAVATAAPATAIPATAAPATGGRGSIQVLFETAAQLEVRDPGAALRIYGELASGSDGWAAGALLASARLEAERGHPARARELLATYLQRFPAGPNADDARELLEKLP